MSDVEMAASLAAAGMLAAITLVLLWNATAGLRRARGEIVRNRDGSFEAVCGICAVRTEVRADALVQLSSAEKALVVREKPEVVGENLVEYVCPHCDASHCFSVSRGALRLVGVNLYEGQPFQVHCKECRKMLEQPPWPAGAFDGRCQEAPGAIDDLGLVCPFCGATCCVACCRSATRNRTGDASFLCPRCFRGPLVQFFHPQEPHTHRN